MNLQKMAEWVLNSSFQYWLPVPPTGGGNMSSLLWTLRVRGPPNSAELCSNEIQFTSQSSFSNGWLLLYC